MFAACLLILTAYASNHAKTTSGATSVSESQMFSADTKARLKTIQADYHLNAISVRDNKIYVTAGMMWPDQLDALQKAIHESLGKDYSIQSVVVK